MSLTCIAKSILYHSGYLDVSETKRKGIEKMCRKQIPKAIQFDENDLNICPVCKGHIETDDKYCKHCGQRIILDLREEN